MDATAKKTALKLTRMANEVLDEVRSKKNPYLEVPTRALSNVKFNEEKRIIELGDETQKRYFFNVGMARKFMQSMVVASTCKEKLLETGKTTSIRDLYYMMKHTLGDTRQNTFEEQDESDPIIEDLEVMVDALREELHLSAAPKGALVGELTLVDGGDTIDARRMGTGGWAIPSIVEDPIIRFKKCDAKFVLLVEKEAVWRRLNEDKFWRKHKSILLHGGGQPPRGVRRLLRRFHTELKLPIYVLVDNDPWGFYIYSVVKQGSINLAYESLRMAVPDARFIGLSSFDREKFGLPKAVWIQLEDGDISRAKQMLQYPWFQDKAWQKEIHHLLKSGVKLEIEALSNKGISYITEEYLPKKIKDKDWLV